MKTKRIQEIEDYIFTKGTLSLDELCSHFNVSKNTIRRDINVILKKGTLKKVYGGVTVADNGLVPFEDRDISHQSEKKAISQSAAQFIEENDIVFIDSGTTTRHIMDFIPPARKATIVTNNLDVINKAVQLENIRIIVIGNMYKRSTNSFIGIDNLATLDKYNIDKAFMATTGISISRGMTNTDFFEFSIKKKIVEKAHFIYILADHSKFDKYTLLTYAPFERADVLITDQELDNKYKIYCREHQIQVYLPSEKGMSGKSKQSVD